LLAMIESAEAVANAGVIAATPGIDGLVIGPSDLSADLGQPGVYDSARYADAIAAVEQAAARATSILGTRPAPFYPVERLIAAGHHFLVVGSDVTSLRDGYRALLASVRGAQ
jgi:2-keto-3-deoxy-L-rhamnonate aldolase RhmA